VTVASQESSKEALNTRIRQGGCFCGAVRYALTGAPRFVCICHCRSCQRATGGAMVPWATYPLANVKVTSGAWSELHSSPGVTRGYCAACGTHLTYSHTGRPGELDITLASLDDASTLAPTAHIWVEDKLPWISIQDGLPQYERTVSSA
jgi:hypothetical protein